MDRIKEMSVSSVSSEEINPGLSKEESNTSFVSRDSDIWEPKNLESAHRDIYCALDDLLCNNPGIIASENGKTALYQAIDQDSNFKNIIEKYLRNPDEKNTPHEAMWALPETVNFNREELGFLIGSIALDKEPETKLQENFFNDWDTQAHVPEPNLKEMQARLKTLQIRLGMQEMMTPLHLGGRRVRDRVMRLQIEMRELREQIKSAQK